MRFLVVDDVIVSDAGVGSAAYFSQPMIKLLKEAGHEIVVSHGPDPILCRTADIVWTEWCSDSAYRIASWDLKIPLIVRIRGFDVWGALNQLAWENVFSLVFESSILRKLAVSRFPDLEKRVNIRVLASGLDLNRFCWKPRRGRGVAMVARADWRKGFQLVIEWARQRPDIVIHLAVALPEANPRVSHWLQGETVPINVNVHFNVLDVPAWFDRTNVGYILSASPWEELGYSIAEGVASGLIPLVYDFPGAKDVWEEEWLWTTLSDLSRRYDNSVWKNSYLEYVANRFDVKTLTNKFLDLVAVVEEGVFRKKSVAEHVSTLAQEIMAQISALPETDRRPALEDLAQSFCTSRFTGGSSGFRSDIAANMARALFNLDALDDAGSWAMRALVDGPRPDVMELMGDLSRGRRPIAARAWYKTSRAFDKIGSLKPHVSRSIRTDFSYVTSGHVLVVQTAFRKHPTFDRTLASLERAGAGEWRGPKYIVSDGYTPEVNSGWNVIRVDYLGHAQTLLHILNLSISCPDFRRLTVFEDDVIAASNSLKYIDGVVLDDDVDMINWCWMNECEYDVDNARLELMESCVYRQSQALSYSKSAIEKLLTDGVELQNTRGVKHGGDQLFSVLSGLTAVHMPSLIQHIGCYESPQGSGELATYSRYATSFPGEDFDALTLLQK